ncbi:MAG TPA: oligosaccharide flippase family protein [Solirubrobacteraceae bacterium]|jgi:PST family polysaccharide transporter|nr:oligosaccharide flippase family protein [Solirubrobacteraceae bacterium]
MPPQPPSHDDATDPAAPGAAERHMARGAFAQQAAMTTGLLIMLVVVTVLGRSLTLSEFGLYGLALSVAAYVLIVQYSVEGAAVRAIAGAPDASSRDALFSTALVVYATLGVGSAVAIVVAGSGLSGVLGIPDELRDEARRAFLALGAVTAAGWPMKACQDALRGTQRFGLAAMGEIVAYLLFGALMAAAIVLDAPLWTLIAIGGSLSALIGMVCMVVLVTVRGGPRLRPRLVTRARIGDLLGVSAGLFVGGAADLFIYSSDRVILAAFRSAATVGLYEAAVRAHNILRQMHGTLVLTVTPVASAYIASADEARLRELLLRGTRYVMAAVVPLTVVLMVLAGPILEVWLGEKFRPAAAALAILCGYWLVGSSTGVAGAMLVAAGKIRELAQFAWQVAITNLVLSLALTPLLGLEGVVLGTTIPYVLMFPIFLRIVLRTFPAVSVRDLVREAWLPAYAGAAVLAVALVVLRVAFELDTLAAVLGAGVAGLALYWGSYYLVWLRPGERVLVRSFLGLHGPSASGAGAGG